MSEALAFLQSRQEVLDERNGLADLDARVARLEQLVSNLMFALYPQAKPGPGEASLWLG